MIVARIDGGIGNQFFQYAFARSRSLALRAPIVLDAINLSSRINRNLVLEKIGVPFERVIYQKNDLTLKDRALKGLCSIKEDSVNFDSKKIKNSRCQYIIGHWQSEYYFSCHKDEIVRELTSNPIYNGLKEFPLDAEDDVAIHVRRGDYVGHPKYFQLTERYFLESLASLREKSRVGRVYIFTDDINWVRQSLRIQDCVFVQRYGLTPLQELFLMSRFRRIIMSNSTFSWWGAYLNGNVDKCVVAPDKWYGEGHEHPKDIYVENWIQFPV